MTSRVAKYRWVRTGCGHVWPDQAGEKAHSYGEWLGPPKRRWQVRGPGSPVLCLEPSCGRTTHVAAYEWREEQTVDYPLNAAGCQDRFREIKGMTKEEDTCS